jgi:hypothetical protein
MTDSTRMPRWPLLLGLAGLIPFYAALWANFSTNPLMQMVGPISLVSYGAVILSFLGGARWGMEIARAPDAPDARRLIASVLPSIAGWIAVVGNFSSVFAINVLTLGFIAQFAWDVKASRSGLAPAWYRTLRAVLTAGVLICLAIEQVRLIAFVGR